jgi:hypothetical protein
LTPLPQIVGGHLVVTRLTSAPAGARLGHAYLLRGSIVNTGGAAARSRIAYAMPDVLGTRITSD